MEKFLAASAPVPDETEDEWRFTKDKPQFADDGCTYRLQLLVSNPRKTRTVRVDDEDHELIVSVNKKR